MPKVIKIRRGLDIPMKGKAEKILVQAGPSEMYAVKPIDFAGLTPKLTVKVDQEVKAGSPLFFDKYHPEVLFTSPVSGKVVSVTRGERRRILEVVVKADPQISYESFKKGDPESMKREEVIENLQKSGLWPFIRQRPYRIIANGSDIPKAIFISGFDTAPLAPDYDFVLKGERDAFRMGIKALSRLTAGDIHISINGAFPVSDVFKDLDRVQLHSFRGPHPAGNVGIQIHHIDPVNKGDIAWTVNPQDVVIIGRLFEKGIFDASRIVTLAGSEVETPRYYKTMLGASIVPLVKDNVKEGNLRYISGNVLTGKKILNDGYIGYYDSMVCVIPEGAHYDFLGWALPGLNKFSMSRTFLAWLTPNREFRLHTNLNGGKRAFVMTGQYEKVLPMDIYPVLLLKAILVEDIDKMENLGIYEVAEEDLALCEYVCTSKTDVQSILRSGIELMIKELG
jgi:Na+-transporting NADH:ubiquinone oxidoreductase subunit A